MDRSNRIAEWNTNTCALFRLRVTDSTPLDHAPHQLAAHSSTLCPANFLVLPPYHPSSLSVVQVSPLLLLSRMQGFEESYVLESTDGLGYTQIKPLPPPPNESEDDRLSRLRRLQLDAQRTQSFLSLRQQLAEQKERKDEEWKQTHNPFKPPRGLDGDEVGWLEEEEERRRERERRRVEEEERERMTFELAVARRKEEEAQRQAEAASKQQSAVAKAGATAALPSTFSFAVAEDDDLTSASSTSAASTSVGGLSGLGVIRVKRKEESTSRQSPAVEKVKRAKSTDDDTRAIHNTSAISPAPSNTTVSQASTKPVPLSPSLSSELPTKPVNGSGAALSALLSYDDDDEDDADD